MNQDYELPHDVDAEKELLSALLVKNGRIVPEVAAIVSVDDFYRPEHRIIYRVILELSAQGTPPNILSIFQELQKTKSKVEFSYLRLIAEISFTNAYAVAHAKIVKEKSELRRLMNTAENLFYKAQQGIASPAEIIAKHQSTLNEISRSATPSNKIGFNEYVTTAAFQADVGEMKLYAERKTGFENLDEYQFFTPGLYVIGATPAAGKTTFCWQLLEQLARKGESCIYCSYEMSRLELFSKSFARELFKCDKNTKLTAAQIRRGATSVELDRVISDSVAEPVNFSVLELQDETVDDLLTLLRPLCTDKTKAPVVCLDYLQIMPTGRESTKLGIDETVRKLKKFQRDTNTTFIVISSFNRTNYAQSVSFESFKESGNIEYTADVVWALQLNVMNEIKGGELVSETRRKIDEAKKQQPRQIHLKCLKNRQGTNYDCFFEYHSAHDYFKPCAPFNEVTQPPEKNPSSEERRIKNGRL